MEHKTVLERLDRFSPEERAWIQQALEYSAAQHAPQRRVSGEPFIIHPVAVAQSLVDDFGADADTVAAGLLHDTVEDTGTSLDDIERRFGKAVRHLVDGVTDAGKGDGLQYIADWGERMHRTHLKVNAHAEQDPRVYLIKFADRWNNLLHCGALRPKNQRRMAVDTLSFHIPVARKLGLARIADEMERIARAVLARNPTV